MSDIEQDQLATPKSIDVPFASARRLAMGAVATGTVNVVKIGLQLLLLPVMARLLGPDEFGVYALALPTISFVTLLADGGMGATLAREPETSALVWSSAFWFLLFTGLVLAATASIFGLGLSYVVHQPRIAPMIGMLSLSLVLLVLSVPAGARLTRRRNLTVGAAAELSANLLGATLAVTLALRGAGAWSLVAQYLTIYLVRAVILNAKAFEMPAFAFSLGAIRPHMASGGMLIGTRLCEYLGRVGENVLIDRAFGTALLGSYTFANQVSRFAGETVGNVSWITLYVQALTGEQAGVVDVHRRMCRMLAVTLFPSSLLAAVAAPELIDWLLGPKWVHLAFMLRVFLPTSALSIVAVQVGAILLARDRFGVFFWCSLGLSIARVIVVALGFWGGLSVVVYGLAVVSLLQFAALLIGAEAPTGCRPLPMLRGLIGPAISTVIAAAICYLVLRMAPPSAALTISGLAIGFASYVACMFLIDRVALLDDFSTMRRLLLSRSAA